MDLFVYITHWGKFLWLTKGKEQEQAMTGYHAVWYLWKQTGEAWYYPCHMNENTFFILFVARDKERIPQN